MQATCIGGEKKNIENSWLFETKRCNWKNNVSFYKHNKDNSAWAIKMSKQFQIIYQCDTYIKILRLKPYRMSMSFFLLLLFLYFFHFSYFAIIKYLTLRYASTCDEYSPFSRILIHTLLALP